MRIAEVAPLFETVPPKLYGGTERVVSWLVEELVRQGQDVTLFASADSHTNAELVPMVPRALWHSGIRDAVPSTLVMLNEVAPLFRHLSTKCVTTLHGRLDVPGLRPFFRVFNEMSLISISVDQRRPMPPVNWLSTIHHGLPEDLYRLHRETGRYLAFLGRISPEKGPDRAIEIAKRSGVPLKIAAKVDVGDREYFATRIEPLLDDPLIEFVGEIDDTQKDEFLGGALALLFPIDWPEPFGLVMIEAMATGTPVIAYNRGSVPEVIDNGVNGIIVSSVDEAVEAVKRVAGIDRPGVRCAFEKRFTAARMAANYIAAFESLGYARQKRPAPRPRRPSVVPLELPEPPAGWLPHPQVS
jgi:glycosyltransferase involved in cell wall biosynthesis